MLAAAGGEDVRGPAPVCLCCRGVCGGRALGAADAGAGGSKACGVQADKHFFCLDGCSPTGSAGSTGFVGCELDNAYICVKQLVVKSAVNEIRSISSSYSGK